MTSPLNYCGGRQFPQSILDDLDARLKTLESAGSTPSAVVLDDEQDCDARIRKWRDAFDVMHRRAMNAEANVRELVSQARAVSPQAKDKP